MVKYVNAFIVATTPDLNDALEGTVWHSRVLSLKVRDDQNALIPLDENGKPVSPKWKVFPITYTIGEGEIVS